MTKGKVSIIAPLGETVTTIAYQIWSMSSVHISGMFTKRLNDPRIVRFIVRWEQGLFNSGVKRVEKGRP
jgi:polyribonucleotide nucleotidyltransferase